MIREAPPIEEVLPAFREFLGDRVMVAHNAAFDFGFLDFEYRRIFGIGLANPVLCTLRMARRFMPSLKRRRLDVLAEHFGLSTEGRHRGLGDARMAAEILSIFLEMAERMGITRLDRLLDDHHRGAAGRRIERHVPPEEIAAIPHAPGVYLMRNERGDLLYIGKARRLRDRVSSYFSASVKAKTAELISHVYKIETRVTRSPLEAALDEARLIRELKPPYNRMLKSAAPAFFIKLDLMDEFPRVTLSTKMSARAGRDASGAVHRASRYRAFGARTVANSRPAHLRRQARAERGFLAVHLRPDGALHRALQPEYRRRRVRRAGARARSRFCADAAALDSRRTGAGARPGGRRDALRRGRALPPSSRSADHARASRDPAERSRDREQPGDRDRRGRRSRGTCRAIGTARDDATLDRDEAAGEVRQFVAENYERYQLKAVERGELEAMSIVARWLRERAPDEGRLIYLTGPSSIRRRCVRATSR